MERGIITINENGAVAMPTVPVWMTMQEISDAFCVFCCDIRRAIRAIYKNMELLEGDTMRYIRQSNGISYDVYSLEMVIAVLYVCSFRQRHTLERVIAANAKDIRPDTVRNTT